MSERSEYSPGEFCWVDLTVPSTEAGAEFYNELVGWDWEAGPEEAGGYGTFTHGGKVVAGMGPKQNDEQPIVWASYISVTDADETARKVAAAGGNVLLEPFDVMDAGRMAVFTDAQGGAFCVWQPGRTQGAELVNEVGSWTWNQLVTTDLEGAKAFYGEVFDWSLEKAEEAPPESPYFMWQVEGQRWEEGLGGAMEMGSDFPPGTPPHWVVHFAVEDAAAAVKTTADSGGQVMMDVFEIPVGKLAGLTDPQGAQFAIIEPDYPEER